MSIDCLARDNFCLSLLILMLFYQGESMASSLYFWIYIDYLQMLFSFDQNLVLLVRCKIFSIWSSRSQMIVGNLFHSLVPEFSKFTYSNEPSWCVYPPKTWVYFLNFSFYPHALTTYHLSWFTSPLEFWGFIYQYFISSTLDYDLSIPYLPC